MKTKLLALFSLLTLLLVSTAILADGRPTGIRIGGVRNLGASGVEIDITVPGTTSLYSGANWKANNTSVWLNNSPGSATVTGQPVWQYVSTDYDVPLPWAIDWGDSRFEGDARLTGPPGGPFVGTFVHTYPPAGSPQTYTITVGDVLCCSPVITAPSKSAKGANGVTTGYVIPGTQRYLMTWGGGTYNSFGYTNFTSVTNARLAVTNTATVNTGTGIPTTNNYGLIALALLLVGSGLLLFRKPQQARRFSLSRSQ